MKQKLFVLLTVMMLPLALWATDGDTFTATTEEGIVVTYTVISESEKTCKIGRGYIKGQGTVYAVDQSVSGSVTIPSLVNGYQVIAVADNAFYNCSNIQSISLPSDVSSIGGSAFSGCTSLASLVIPDNVTTIDDRAFCNCSNLTSINIPSGVTRIEDLTFRGCGDLRNINLPASIQFIGEQAFYECSSLESIKVPNGAVVGKDGIQNSTFSGCNNLRRIEIGDNVRLYQCLFYSLPSLTEVVYGKSVSTSSETFKRTYPSATLYVPEDRFDYYYNSPDNTIFGTIRAKTQEYTDDQGVEYTLNEDGNTYSVSGHTDECSGDITILETVNGCSVTSIGSDAFIHCSGLTSITIPQNVTGIDMGLNCDYPYSPFFDCNDLASIVVEEGNTNYDSRDNCNAIIEKRTKKLIVGCKNTKIPNSVTSIGDFAFIGCGGLTSIFIPKSVTEFGFALHSCTGLTSIIVEEGNPVFDSRNNCNAIIRTETNTLIAGCKNSIIPDGVTTIGYNAFVGCSGLTSIIIPKSVTSILSWSFGAITGLTDVYCYAGTVPTTDATAFEMSNIGNAALHVPVGSVDAYKAATPWKDFKEMVGLTGSVKLSKTKANIEKGKTLTLKASVSPSTLLDKSVTWKSSSTKIAKVSSSGKVTGVGAGTATITCTHVATGAKATCKVTIGYVTLDKTVVSVKKGKTVTLTPTVYPSTLTDKSVTWKSSDTNIATVSSDGKVKGVKYGQATITCTSVATGLSTTCLVTVGSIILDESVLTLEKGKTFTLEPTVYPSTLEDKSVTWKSSDTGIATVSSSGKVKGVKAGTATITCTSVTTGLSATCEVTVSYVKLDKTTASVNTGKTLTLKATVYPSTLDDRSVTWKSSNTKIATVSTSGKVKGVKAGTATITCTSNATGLSASCKVTVGSVSLDKTTLTLQKGKTSTLTATVAPSTLADQSVTWKSSDTGIATVSSSGKVKGVKYGTATITCTSNATGLSTSCEVTVVYVKLSKTTVGLEKGKTLTLKATVYPSTLDDRSVTWKSSDTKIATVSSSGKVTGVGYGTATITCTSKATGIKATCKVTVGKVVLSMSDFSIKKSRAITLEATVYPETLADQSVTWESSDTNIATVSSTGRIKGVKAGTVTITCTSNATGLSASCTVTVLAVSESRSFEGDDDDTTGIGELENAPAEEQPYDVYDLSGRKVAHQVTTLDGLPNGIYIVNGKKVLKK